MTTAPENQLLTAPETPENKLSISSGAQPEPPQKPSRSSEIEARVKLSRELLEGLPPDAPRSQRMAIAGRIGRAERQLKRLRKAAAQAELEAVMHDGASLLESGDVRRALAAYRSALAQTTEPVSPLVVALMRVAEASLAYAQRTQPAAPTIEVPPEQPEWWHAVWSRSEPAAEPEPEPEPKPQPAQSAPSAESPDDVAERLQRVRRARWIHRELGWLTPDLPEHERERALGERAKQELNAELASAANYIKSGAPLPPLK